MQSTTSSEETTHHTVSEPQITPLPTSLVLSQAWGFFKSQPLMSVGLIVIPMIIVGVSYGLLMFSAMSEDSPQLIMTAIYYLINSAVSIGAIAVSLKIVRGQKATMNDWIAKIHRVFHALVAGFLMQIIILAGFFLFIIPGIIFSVRFAFTPIVLIDTELGIIDSFRASWNMTRGRTLELIILGILLVIVLGFLTIITLGLGLIIIAPLGYLVWMHVYNILKPTEIVSV